MCTKQYLSQHDLAILHRFAREHGATVHFLLVDIVGVDAPRLSA